MHKFVLPGILLLCSAAVAWPATNTPERQMTLEDCIALAVENNLGVQIERINPEIARNNLSLAYAGWEPTLTGDYSRDYSLSPGGIDEQNRPFQGSETDSHSFFGGINGLMPWGTIYRLGVSGTDSFGTRPGFEEVVVGGVTNIVAVRVPFETASARVGALTLSQPLLRNAWIDSTRLRITLAKRDIESSEYALRQRLNDTVFAVQNAYYDLIAARENVKVQEKALQLAERLLAENKKRVEVGALAPLDERRTESEVAASQADMLAAKQVLSFRQNDLKSLITDNYVEWHAVDIVPGEMLLAVPETFDLQESWNTGLSRRPDLLQARVNLERRDITLRFDRNQLFPQLNVDGTVGYTGSGEEFSDAFGQVRRRDNPFWSVGASISVPLGNRSARENYKISKAQKTQLVLQLKSVEQRVMVEVDDALKQAQSSYERVDATRQARVYAEAALDAEQKKLENGKSTSFQVLQFQRDLTARRSEEIRALADYNKALAQLAHAEGTTLGENDVTLELK